MKTLIMILAVVVMIGGTVRAYPPAPATQAQVNAGTEPYLYVTPKTLAGAGVITQNVSAAVLGGLTISNSTYGSLVMQKGAGASDVQLDTYQGALRTLLAPANVGAGGNSWIWQEAAGYSYLTWWGGTSSLIECWNNPSGNNSLWGGVSPIHVFASAADEYKLYNHGFFNLPITDYGIRGGSLMAGEDVPIHGNEIIAADPTCPVVMSTYIGLALNTNEVAASNCLQLAANAGVIAAVTNAGGTFWLHTDDSCLIFNTNRNAQGELSINTNNFPSGSNFANVVHNFGAKWRGTTYYYPFPTNTIYGNGQWMTNVPGSPYSPFMSLNTIQLDVSKFYDFGMDGIRVADVQNTGTGVWLATSRWLAENVLMPYCYLGQQTKLAYSAPADASTGGKGRYVPLDTEILTTQMGFNPAQCVPQVNIIGHDYVYNGLFPGQQTNAINLIKWMSEMRNAYYTEIPMLGPGHYRSHNCQFFANDYSTLDARNALTITWASLAQLQFGCNYTNATLAAARPNFLTNVTNSVFMKMFCDSLSSRPVKVFDYGVTNCSAYFRQLNAGAYGVAIFNESPNQTNQTIYFTNLFANPTVLYTVQDVWSNQTYTVTGSSFTSTNIPAQGCALLYLTTRAPNLLPASIPTTNAAVNGYALRYTNGVFYWAP